MLKLWGPKRSPYLGSKCGALLAQGGGFCSRHWALPAPMDGLAPPGRVYKALPWCEEGGQPWATLQGLYLNSPRYYSDHRVMDSPRAELWARCQGVQNARHSPALEKDTV